MDIYEASPLDEPCKYCDYCISDIIHTVEQHKKNYMKNYQREYKNKHRIVSYKRGNYKIKST